MTRQLSSSKAMNGNSRVSRNMPMTLTGLGAGSDWSMPRASLRLCDLHARLVPDRSDLDVLSK
jgi:hypothetical protein